MIQVPSEGNDNPIDKVIFYKKPKGKNLPPAVLELEEVQQMVSNNQYDACYDDYYTPMSLRLSC